MRTKEEVLLSIKEGGMVAVVRGEISAKAMEIVEKCIEGGIRAIELTFTVPYAHRVIEDISRKYGEEIILGAGSSLMKGDVKANAALFVGNIRKAREEK